MFHFNDTRSSPQNNVVQNALVPKKRCWVTSVVSNTASKLTPCFYARLLLGLGVSFIVGDANVSSLLQSRETLRLIQFCSCIFGYGERK